MSQKGSQQAARAAPRREPGAGPRLIYFSHLLNAFEQITYLFVAFQWGSIKLFCSSSGGKDFRDVIAL